MSDLVQETAAACVFAGIASHTAVFQIGVEMDVSKAGTVVAEQMGALERDYGDNEGYEIGGVISILLINGPDGSNFRIRSNMGNPAMTLGAIRMAEDEFLRALRTEGGLEQSGGDSE